MTTWHYNKQGAIRDEQVGPIDTETLARRIERGEIKPDTLIASGEKTGGKWVPMRAFAKLVVIYERGVETREAAKAEAKAEKQALKVLAKQEKARARHGTTRGRLAQDTRQPIGPPVAVLEPTERLAPVAYAQPAAPSSTPSQLRPSSTHRPRSQGPASST